MATAEQIKALVKSHTEGDDARFYSVAMQVAAAEAKQGHTDFATELRLLIDKAREKQALPLPGGTTISMAAPRGELAELLAAFYPETRLSDMILTPELNLRLQRILDEQRQIAMLKGHDLHPRQRSCLWERQAVGRR